MLTKKPPQRDDIIQTRRRGNDTEPLEAAAQLRNSDFKGFVNVVRCPSAMILVGAAMRRKQTSGA